MIILKLLEHVAPLISWKITPVYIPIDVNKGLTWPYLKLIIENS